MADFEERKKRKGHDKSFKQVNKFYPFVSKVAKQLHRNQLTFAPSL